MLVDSFFTKIFENTEPTYFNDHSKYVFFADVHRGDNCIADEFAANKNLYYYALAYYYSKDFTYVEVGDGDELWERPRYNVIIDAHSNIYTLLKNFYDDGRMVMIYGNHNIQLRKKKFVDKYLSFYHDDFLDQDIELFPGLVPVEALVLQHEDTGQKILVVHGHQGDIFNHTLWPLTFVGIRFFWRFLHIIGFNYATSPAQNKDRRRRMENQYSKWASAHKTPIICGHTHLPRFPKVGEPAYFNPGCCIHPRGITALELENGKMRLVDWTIKPDSQGFLYISRSVRNSSEQLANFSTGIRVQA